MHSTKADRDIAGLNGSDQGTLLRLPISHPASLLAAAMESLVKSHGLFFLPAAGFFGMAVVATEGTFSNSHGPFKHVATYGEARHKTLPPVALCMSPASGGLSHTRPRLHKIQLGFALPESSAKQ